MPKDLDQKAEYARGWRDRCFQKINRVKATNLLEVQIRAVGLPFFHCTQSGEQSEKQLYHVHAVFVPLYPIHGSLKEIFYASIEMVLKLFIFSDPLFLFLMTEIFNVLLIFHQRPLKQYINWIFAEKFYSNYSKLSAVKCLGQGKNVHRTISMKYWDTIE